MSVKKLIKQQWYFAFFQNILSTLRYINHLDHRGWTQWKQQLYTAIITQQGLLFWKSPCSFFVQTFAREVLIQPCGHFWGFALCWRLHQIALYCEMCQKKKKKKNAAFPLYPVSANSLTKGSICCSTCVIVSMPCSQFGAPTLNRSRPNKAQTVLPRESAKYCLTELWAKASYISYMTNR